MKHLGTQHFKNINASNEVTAFTGNILNKLNIPLHRPLEGAIYGDVFFEGSQINITNSDNEIVSLLDINNPDVLKSLLLSEIVFDEFYNHDKEQEASGSFHTKVDTTTLDQLDINYTLDCTTD